MNSLYLCMQLIRATKSTILNQINHFFLVMDLNQLHLKQSVNDHMPLSNSRCPRHNLTCCDCFWDIFPITSQFANDCHCSLVSSWSAAQQAGSCVVPNSLVEIIFPLVVGPLLLMWFASDLPVSLLGNRGHFCLTNYVTLHSSHQILKCHAQCSLLVVSTGRRRFKPCSSPWSDCPGCWDKNY